jgi:hypothetical protein
MKNAVFWDDTQCGSCKNRSFGGTYHLHHQSDIVFLLGVLQLLGTANVVPSSPILATVIMEAIRISDTSDSTRATRFTIPEDGILRSHRRENLKSENHPTKSQVLQHSGFRITGYFTRRITGSRFAHGSHTPARIWLYNEIMQGTSRSDV